MTAILQRVVFAQAVHTPRFLHPSFKGGTLSNVQHVYAPNKNCLVRLFTRSRLNKSELERQYKGVQYKGVYALKESSIQVNNRINRLRKRCLWATAIATPFMLLACHYNFMDKDAVTTAYATLAVLFVCSTAFFLFQRKVVWRVAVSVDHKVARITYAGFWRKQHSYYRVQDIVPLREYNKIIKNKKIQIMFRNCKDKYDLNMAKSSIDKKLFTILFGKL